jgi:hypothetical protein
MITDYLECIEIEGTRQIKQYEPIKIRVKLAIHDGWEETAIEVKRAINRILYSEFLEVEARNAKPETEKLNSYNF